VADTDRPETHDAILVPVDVFVGDCQTQGAATTCSSSRAVRFGMEGATGGQNGELQVIEVGKLEAKDAAGEGPAHGETGVP
jgi:hypothetical protein